MRSWVFGASTTEVNADADEANVERAALDPGSAKYVDAYLDRLTKGFRNALDNAQRDGNVSKDANPDDLAAHFVNAVVGISALLRARATPEQMFAAGRGATSMLLAH